MLLVKCLSAPLLIVAATLITRRWGPIWGGMFTSLPLMSGPISVFLALEQGASFAALSARASMLGFVAMGAYCLAYRHVSRRMFWLPAMLLSATAYFGTAALLEPLTRSTWLSAVVSVAGLTLVIRLLGRPPACCGHISSPWWDLPLRVAAIAAMVLLVTGMAQMAGSAWSGFLSTFPIFTALMASFTLAEGGPDATAMLLHGVCVGLYSSVAFFLVLALVVEHLSIAPSYVLAVLISLAVNALIIFILNRRQPLPR